MATKQEIENVIKLINELIPQNLLDNWIVSVSSEYLSSTNSWIIRLRSTDKAVLKALLEELEKIAYPGQNDETAVEVSTDDGGRTFTKIILDYFSSINNFYFAKLLILTTQQKENVKALLQETYELSCKNKSKESPSMAAPSAIPSSSSLPSSGQQAEIAVSAEPVSINEGASPAVNEIDSIIRRLIPENIISKKRIRFRLLNDSIVVNSTDSTLTDIIFRHLSFLQSAKASVPSHPEPRYISILDRKGKTTAEYKKLKELTLLEQEVIRYKIFNEYNAALKSKNNDSKEEQITLTPGEQTSINLVTKIEQYRTAYHVCRLAESVKFFRLLKANPFQQSQHDNFESEAKKKNMTSAQYIDQLEAYVQKEKTAKKVDGRTVFIYDLVSSPTVNYNFNRENLHLLRPIYQRGQKKTLFGQSGIKGYNKTTTLTLEDFKKGSTPEHKGDRREVIYNGFPPAPRK